MFYYPTIIPHKVEENSYYCEDNADGAKKNLAGVMLARHIQTPNDHVQPGEDVTRDFDSWDFTSTSSKFVQERKGTSRRTGCEEDVITLDFD